MDCLPHKGSSMWPVICDGDEVLLDFFSEPVSIHDCHCGDVILHREHGEWVLHRVVEINGRKVSKGDFSNTYFYSVEKNVWGVASSSSSSRIIASLSSAAAVQRGFSRKLTKLALCICAKVQRVVWARHYLAKKSQARSSQEKNFQTKRSLF